jgi:hypothetical protein
MTLADHGVALPVTEALPGIDNGRPLIDRDLVGNDAAPVIGPVALAPWFLATQIPVQVAA